MTALFAEPRLRPFLPARSLRLALACACAAVVCLRPAVRAELRAGAAVVDVTPPSLPVLVNGGMISRTVDKIKTRVNARALALADGRERIVIVVVDSCMMDRASTMDPTAGPTRNGSVRQQDHPGRHARRPPVGRRHR